MTLSGSLDILNATSDKGDIYHRAQVAMRLDLIMDPGYLQGLKKDLGRRFEGQTRETPHGKIVLGGAGDDHHQGPDLHPKQVQPVRHNWVQNL